MYRLTKDRMIIQPSDDGIHVIASFYEHPVGWRWWDKYHLSGFPNYLASIDDFKRCGIDIIDGKPLIGN